MDNKNKPSIDEIIKKHPKMIRVKKSTEVPNFAQLKEILQESYKMAQTDHLNPQGVYD